MDPIGNRRRRASLTRLLGWSVGSLAGGGLARVALTGAALTGAGHAAAQSAARPDRTALVIGNANYLRGPLRNPVNDARLVARTLRELGYRVQLLEDANFAQMGDAARTWLVGSRDALSRVFYFAGHGVQMRGRNYLLPVDADAPPEDEQNVHALNVTELVDRLARFDSGVNLVILDACRNLPLPQIATGPRNRGLGGADRNGLAPVSAPRGTVVAFSTAPGSVAADGAAGSHSTYTRHLVDAIQVPGLPIEAVFKRVRAAVLEDTGNAQTPWETSSLVGDFCMKPGVDGQCEVGTGRSRVVNLRKL